jgi:G3E family GTPase
MRRFVLDGVVTVVDAVHAVGTLSEHAEARCQVAVADRLVVTKSRHAEALEQAPELAIMLAQLAPHAVCLDADSGEAVASALFNAAPWICSASAANGPLSAGDPAHHGDIRTTTLWSDAPLPPAALGLFAEFLRSADGMKVLRLKGLVRTTDDPERPVVIHGVQHMFDQPRRLNAWPDEDRRTRIVVIAKDLDATLIARLYDAFAGATQIANLSYEAVTQEDARACRAG